jgi:uncharacterized protein
MASLNSIQTFLASKNIAVVGVSRTGSKFGFFAFQHLRSAGHNAIPVNNNTNEIFGNICYHDLIELKNKVDSALLIIPPEEALKVVHDAVKAGIKNIWFQPGSESKEAIELCKSNDLNYVDKQCIMMHSEPVVSMHKFHRFVKKILRQYPV